MYHDVLERVAESFSGARARDLAVDLWNIDRWFDFTHFRRSASYSAERMAEAALDQVRMISFAADGRTPYGDWVAPLAWDVSNAELEIRSPQILPLCSYRKLPVSLAMWSGPTPPEGVEAEVVLVDGWEGLDGPVETQVPDPRLAGKILFGSRPGPELKRLAARHAALGTISQHGAAYGAGQTSRTPDKVSWINAWSDHPFGWPFTRADTPAWGFSLSQRQGSALLDLLQTGAPVRAWARVDTQHYDGHFDFVTGQITGRQPEQEVLVFAHLYEQGAQDNAGGCAVVLEAARCLNSLIGQGRLPEPRRTIRFVLSWEIYGLLAYATTRPADMRRIVAGLNLDSLGVPHALCNALLEVHPNPHSQASYTDTLIEHIAQDHLPVGTWRTVPFDTTDSVIADPTIGVPMPWLGEMVSSLWHSSLDTPEKIDPAALARAGSVAATYLYAVANASTPEVEGLAREVYRDATALVSRAAAEGGGGNGRTARRLHYLVGRGSQALASCARLDPTDEMARVSAELAAQLAAQVADRAAAPVAPEAPAAAGPGSSVPVRKVAGGLSLGGLPHDAWPAAQRATNGENPRWSALLCCALYWADGRRSIDEIRELVQEEFGTLSVDLLQYFTFLAQYGYIDLIESPA